MGLNTSNKTLISILIAGAIAFSTSIAYYQLGNETETPQALTETQSIQSNTPVFNKNLPNGGLTYSLPSLNSGYNTSDGGLNSLTLEDLETTLQEGIFSLFDLEIATDILGKTIVLGDTEYFFTNYNSINNLLENKGSENRLYVGESSGKPLICYGLVTIKRLEGARHYVFEDDIAFSSPTELRAWASGDNIFQRKTSYEDAFVSDIFGGLDNGNSQIETITEKLLDLYSLHIPKILTLEHVKNTDSIQRFIQDWMEIHAYHEVGHLRNNDLESAYLEKDYFGNDILHSLKEFNANLSGVYNHIIDVSKTDREKATILFYQSLRDSTYLFENGNKLIKQEAKFDLAYLNSCLENGEVDFEKMAELKPEISALTTTTYEIVGDKLSPENHQYSCDAQNNFYTKLLSITGQEPLF